MTPRTYEYVSLDMRDLCDTREIESTRVLYGMGSSFVLSYQNTQNQVRYWSSFATPDNRYPRLIPLDTLYDLYTQMERRQ